MQSQICPSCGFQTSPNLAACPQCGTSFSVATPAAQVVPIDYHATDPRSGFFREYFAKGFAATFGMVIALFLMNVIFWLIAGAVILAMAVLGRQ